MDSTDQVAIHEAMEQQTISITKAGIQATLNARTSILAAANPVFGRYDRTKTLKANIAISAAIMSRFDLFFIIVDECNPKIDALIAQQIVKNHAYQGQQTVQEQAPFSRAQLQKYIAFARTIHPMFTAQSRNTLVECYRLLRSNDMLGKNKTAYRITVRQLESLVRLSEGLARLHLDPEVKEIYVREAYRLLQRSIIFVEAEDVELEADEEDGPRDGDGDGDGAEGVPPVAGEWGRGRGRCVRTGVSSVSMCVWAVRRQSRATRSCCRRWRRPRRTTRRATRRRSRTKTRRSAWWTA